MVGDLFGRWPLMPGAQIYPGFPLVGNHSQICWCFIAFQILAQFKIAYGNIPAQLIEIDIQEGYLGTSELMTQFVAALRMHSGSHIVSLTTSQIC